MAVNYDKLWVILKEREMLKTDLIKAAKISTNAMAKLGKNEDVRIGVLVKICQTLGCKLDDIIDIIQSAKFSKNLVGRKCTRYMFAVQRRQRDVFN